jgi:hypothetical protein
MLFVSQLGCKFNTSLFEIQIFMRFRNSIFYFMRLEIRDFHVMPHARKRIS